MVRDKIAWTTWEYLNSNITMGYFDSYIITAPFFGLFNCMFNICVGKGGCIWHRYVYTTVKRSSVLYFVGDFIYSYIYVYILNEGFNPLFLHSSRF